MSRPDKLEFMQAAKAHGYKIELVFVTTNDPEINKARIEIRVAEGGHDVPSEKIVSRYYRSMQLLADAVKIADEAKVYDNSSDHPQLVFHKLPDGLIWIEKQKTRPTWVDEYLIHPLQASGDISEHIDTLTSRTGPS